MRLAIDDVEDLARGAAILGTGGGGDPYLGRLMLRQVLEDGLEVRLVPVESVADDALLVPFAMMGAPTVIVEKFPNGAEMLAALHATEKHIGEPAQAVMCVEIGGMNALLPLVLAARAGLPVVDGDGMGRAFPQLQMTTFHILGVTAAPMILADEYSSTAVVDAAAATHVEHLGRALAVAMGGSTSICVYSMRGAQAKRTLVRGTISLALGLGRAIREGRRTKLDPFEEMFAFLRRTEYFKHCRMLFDGKIVDLLRETRGGWTFGRVMIAAGNRRCTVEFQNEHLVAREGERVLAIVPDLIAVLDATTAEPVTTEALRYGQRVRVVGISAAPIMRSPEALRVFGPRAFGIDADFVPVEALDQP